MLDDPMDTISLSWPPGLPFEPSITLKRDRRYGGWATL